MKTMYTKIALIMLTYFLSMNLSYGQLDPLPGDPLPGDPDPGIEVPLDGGFFIGLLLSGIGAVSFLHKKKNKF